jgi:hypothetical protein
MEYVHFGKDGSFLGKWYDILNPMTVHTGRSTSWLLYNSAPVELPFDSSIFEYGEILVDFGIFLPSYEAKFEVYVMRTPYCDFPRETVFSGPVQLFEAPGLNSKSGRWYRKGCHPHAPPQNEPSMT